MKTAQKHESMKCLRRFSIEFIKITDYIIGKLVKPFNKVMTVMVGESLWG